MREPPAHASASGGQKVFLLVEDSPDDAFLVDTEFRRFPKARLCIVREGQEAIDYLQGKPPYDDRKEFPVPDIILLDLKMPKMDGFEVLRWIRSQKPRDIGLIPVVIMTGSISNEEIKRAYQDGANCVVTKPVDWSKLRGEIGFLLAFWCESVKTIQRTANVGP